MSLLARKEKRQCRIRRVRYQLGDNLRDSFFTSPCMVADNNPDLDFYGDDVLPGLGADFSGKRIMKDLRDRDEVRSFDVTAQKSSPGVDTNSDEQLKLSRKLA